VIDQHWDVVVIGGGNAAMVSAMAAAHHVDRVLVLERSTKDMRGGNTRHTRNVRCVHAQADDYNTGSYLFEELWDDLCKVGTGPNNEKLAELTVRESETAPAWMSEHGIRWQPPLSGTLHLGRTNRFFLGGGKALLNKYYRTAASLGVTVRYEARVDDLIFDGPTCTGLVVDVSGTTQRISATAVVAASGGFEANIEWLRQYWGDAADNYLIRGPRTNDGAVLAKLYEHGADKAGEERGFHAVAVDARAPRFDGGIATRLDSIPFGIVVNRDGVRFYDEGEEIWPKRYAIWGGNIARQPDQIAYCLWDAKVRDLFLPPMYGAVEASDIAGVAGQLGLDPATVHKTVEDYNAAIAAPNPFDPAVLDGNHTTGLRPDKTNWAQRLDAPPYYGIAMRPGITFTYMGVAVTDEARVLRADGSTFSNLFAAGEIMSGNVLSSGYLAGFGMTIGTVWGRIAGSEAARHVHR
jgi:tricarballylate dehydrogenase